MEDLAGSARMNAAAAVEGEQWCSDVGFRKGGAAPLDLGTDQLSNVGAMRHEAALAELAASHHQQVAVSLNIAQAEAAGLSCAQTEPVAETEDGTIGRTALPGSRVIRECGCRGQQTAGLDDIENERDAVGGHSTPPDLERRDGQQLLDDGPIQKATNHAQEVVEAPRTASWPRSQEGLQRNCRELVQDVDALGCCEVHQQP